MASSRRVVTGSSFGASGRGEEGPQRFAAQRVHRPRALYRAQRAAGAARRGSRQGRTRPSRRPSVDVQSLTPPDPHRSQRLAVGVIAGILVYVALMLYGQMVAQGVVEEKTSRIVELLLTAIRPWQLLLGKVLGHRGAGARAAAAGRRSRGGDRGPDACADPAWFGGGRRARGRRRLVPARLPRVRADVRRRGRAGVAAGRRRRRCRSADGLHRRPVRPGDLHPAARTPEVLYWQCFR